MRRFGLYPKLATQAMRLNARFYLPYLLSCIVIVALHYDIQFLNMNRGMDQLPGSSSISGLLSIVILAVDLFSAFLLFYTNSFLMKRRQRELGLYSILGMEKRHIRRLLRWETFFVGILGIGGGLLLGIALSSLFLALFSALMQVSIPLGFEIPRIAVIYTVFVYATILLLNLIANLGRVSLSKPIELFHGTEAGDREPRTKRLSAAFGVLLLLGGYSISFFTNPFENLLLFLAAVSFVILATYRLFSVGSVTVLKGLRKNKEYYYQPQHFFAVSGMLHRTGRNAKGLATICVLSTMALVTTSATLALYVGAGPVATQVGDKGQKILMCAYFFVGLFLSVLFLMATALILYYKLVSEGHEDAKDFYIMQQIGMTTDEVRTIIRGQASLSFLPPLVVATCHMAAALPMTSKILAVLGIDIPLVVTCAAATVIVYSAFYLLVYGLSAYAYRHIVQSFKQDSLAKA